MIVILLAAPLPTPAAAHANPVVLNPSSLLAFCIVAFRAVVVEAGVVPLLAFRGAAALRVPVLEWSCLTLLPSPRAT